MLQRLRIWSDSVIAIFWFILHYWIFWVVKQLFSVVIKVCQCLSQHENTSTAEAMNPDTRMNRFSSLPHSEHTSCLLAYLGCSCHDARRVLFCLVQIWAAGREMFYSYGFWVDVLLLTLHMPQTIQKHTPLAPWVTVVVSPLVVVAMSWLIVG